MHIFSTLEIAICKKIKTATMPTDWYHIQNIDELDSPALCVFPDRIQRNIDQMLRYVNGEPKRLRPHVKTYKMSEVVHMQMESGIQQFKFATIAEGEMLGAAGAQSALLAYQPVGPKVQRLLSLIEKFPNTNYTALVDNTASAKKIASVFAQAGRTLEVYLDIDVGMHRTGLLPDDEALELWQFCEHTVGILPVGLHVYDGHIRDAEYEVRKAKCDAAFALAEKLAQQIFKTTEVLPKIVAGGSPTFTVHKDRAHVQCSPGTCLLWDWGYGQQLPEQEFEPAAVLVSRIISKPEKQLICTDLGHKSVAAEKPFPRVHFLNLPEAKAVSQSEEHLVLDVGDNSKLQVEDVLYGIPIHICPTVALYERVFVVKNQQATDSWQVIARDRHITV